MTVRAWHRWVCSTIPWQPAGLRPRWQPRPLGHSPRQGPGPLRRPRRKRHIMRRRWSSWTMSRNPFGRTSREGEGSCPAMLTSMLLQALKSPAVAAATANELPLNPVHMRGGETDLYGALNERSIALGTSAQRRFDRVSGSLSGADLREPRAKRLAGGPCSRAFTSCTLLN